MFKDAGFQTFQPRPASYAIRKNSARGLGCGELSVL